MTQKIELRCKSSLDEEILWFSFFLLPSMCGTHGKGRSALAWSGSQLAAGLAAPACLSLSAQRPYPEAKKRRESRRRNDEVPGCLLLQGTFISQAVL